MKTLRILPKTPTLKPNKTPTRPFPMPTKLKPKLQKNTQLPKHNVRKSSNLRETLELPIEEHKKITLEQILTFLKRRTGFYENAERNKLPPQKREIHDLVFLLLQAVSEGKIKNLEEFPKYLENFLKETTEMNENQVKIEAKKAYEKFIRSLGTNKNRQELANLIRQFNSH